MMPPPRLMPYSSRSSSGGTPHSMGTATVMRRHSWTPLQAQRGGAGRGVSGGVECGACSAQEPRPRDSGRWPSRAAHNTQACAAARPASNHAPVHLLAVCAWPPPHTRHHHTHPPTNTSPPTPTPAHLLSWRSVSNTSPPRLTTASSTRSNRSSVDWQNLCGRPPRQTGVREREAGSPARSAGGARRPRGPAPGAHSQAGAESSKQARLYFYILHPVSCPPHALLAASGCACAPCGRTRKS